MDESKIEELIKIKAIGELMMNQDASNPVEFGAGIVNSLGRQITEAVDKVLDKNYR